MRLDLDLLKKHLNWFADERNLTIKEIGDLADKCSSVDEFKSKLDELCLKKIGKTSLEMLAEFNVRLPDTKTSSKPQPSQNSALRNELVEVQGKIDELVERDKAPKAESES